MKVSELKQLLENYPDDTEIIMSKDSEGNNYSPLSQVAGAIYIPETTWFGDIYSPEWSAEDACMDEAEREEFKKNAKISLVLWPVN